MAWAKLDDGFYDNPKVVAIPRSAVGLWSLAASYCAKHLTGGFISDVSLQRVAPGVDPLSGTRVGSKSDPSFDPSFDPKFDPYWLVKSGLWYRVDLGQKGYQFHDWDVYNPDSKSAKASREGMSDGGREGNHRRWHAKRGVKVDDCEFCFPPAETPSGHDRVPESPPESAPESSVPSRPDPLLIEGQMTPDLFDDFWAVYPRRVKKKDAHEKFKKIVNDGVKPEAIIEGAKAYAKSVEGEAAKHIAHPTSWLNQGRWEDEETINIPEERNSLWSNPLPRANAH